MTIRRPIAQGDLLFIPVETIPATAKVKSSDGDVHIVGHSETGHHHVIDRPKAEFFEAADNEFIAYVRSLGDAEVVHKRPHDTHKAVVLSKGDWEVRRQREYVPEGFRRVAD